MERPRIAIVGVCAAGKSTLAARLRALGYDARQVSQEHSGVLTMWQRIAHPDLVIFLDAKLPTIMARQQRDDWTEDYLAEQHRRLADVRRAADFYLATDDLTPDEVLARAFGFLLRVIAKGQT